MHIVADLYAEVVGVVAQSRYFMHINVYVFLSCIHVKCLHAYRGMILTVVINSSSPQLHC